MLACCEIPKRLQPPPQTHSSQTTLFGFHFNALKRASRLLIFRDSLRITSVNGITTADGQKLAWMAGSSLPCFGGGAPGRPSRAPVTIQAYNRALAKASAVFAADRGDPLLADISGHSMRRTAVHLFEAKGVTPSAGMAFTGHKSLEVYMRYATRPSVRFMYKVAETTFAGCGPDL